MEALNDAMFSVLCLQKQTKVNGSDEVKSGTPAVFQCKISILGNIDHHRIHAAVLCLRIIPSL